MRLDELRVEGLRSLEPSRLVFEGASAVIWGANGAGKTSLLEAVHVLAAGRSFRTRSLDVLIARNGTALTVFGVARNGEGRHRLGVQRERGMLTRAVVNGESAGALSRLAEQFAVRTVTPESHELVSGGPAQRRALVDWALFHVEHRYREQWRRYERVLRQRNAALKSRSNTAPWDAQMALAGQEVSDARARHLAEFSPHFEAALSILVPELSIGLVLRRGWSERHESLGAALTAVKPTDAARGYTSVGPHRDDVEIRVNGGRATDVLSRGQEKLVASALVLAQVRWLADARGEPPVVLLDDLASELDEGKRSALLAAFEETGAQLILTGLDSDTLLLPKALSPKVFHVEHGHFTEVV